MARYYSTFDNTTLLTLEQDAATYRFKRLPFTGDGAALKAAALSARAALDSNVRPQINLANNNGSLGIIVPRDAMSRGASNITVANLYTNSAAVYQADPRTRPTSDILIANATPVNPVDSLSIPNTLYDDATAKVTALLQGTGLYGLYLGTDANKTMRSLWHDHDLTYFAWDTFTPEPPVIAGNYFSNQVVQGGTTITAKVMWSEPHPTDKAEAYADWWITIDKTEEIAPDHTSGGVTSSANFGTVTSPDNREGAYVINGGLEGGWRYRFVSKVTFRYPSGGAQAPQVENVTYHDIY